jgi:TonB-linked SusC/RagA family outer membrane protein
MVVQQAKPIKGTVVDKQGEPIIGANVSAKGTTNGTITDINGGFSLNIPEKSVLIISYLGYITQEISVGNNAVFNIVLQEDTKTLDEVIVIGYGTSRKKDITGSVASVRADDLNIVASPNVTQMLQGKVAGMSAIQSSAQPGAGMNITIRGAASPSGSNDPLYVIDGVPLQSNSSGDPGLFGIDYKHGTDRSPLNTINPSDIESIEVLKDASAAAIYGASAANGVVLITTKSGKSGKVKVDYRGAYTHQIRKDYPEVLDALNFREQVNFWSKEYYLYNNKMGVYGNNAIDLNGYNPIFANVNDYQANTNWIDEVSRQGYIVDQNLSVNGGNEKTKYFFSYNFYDNVGMFNQSEMLRHSIRMNLDQEFSKRLKAGIKVNYSNVTNYSTSVGPQGQGDNMLKDAFSYAPDIPVKDENGKYSRSYDQLINNPASFNEVEDKTITERIFIAPNFDLKLLDGLSLKGVGGYDTQSSTRQFYIPVSANQTGAMANGFANASFAKVINLSGEAYFNYDKVFNDIHRVSAVLGAGYYKTQNEGFGAAAFGFFTDAFSYDNLGIANDKEREQLKSWKGERTKLSQFARLNYSLMDKYILTLTARRDGSSYFAKNNKWAFFPSISAAWRIKEENFMQGLATLSDLKLRAGYGTVGNENVLGVNALSLYQSGYNYLIGNTVHTGLALTQIENPNLKWETNYTINVGIDYGFFNQRLSGSIEYFYRGVRDLLDYQQLPGNNAVGRVAANIGETKSEGFEFSLRSENLTHEQLKWSTTLNVSYFKANWVKRNPEVALADYIGEKDELDAIYGWKTDGIIISKEDIPSYMPNANIGNVKYVDHNGDGVLDSKDVVKLGNKTPRWFIGLDNTFSYKGFDLNFYLYSALGYKKTRGQIPDASTLGNHGSAPGNTYTTVGEVWNSQTGTGWIPGIATNPYDSSNPTGTNNFYLMDGSYLKLKSITLGYTLPQSAFKSSNFIQNARFFIDAQNVFTITNYYGFDPELYTDNPYPQALSLTFGINLSF